MLSIIIRNRNTIRRIYKFNRGVKEQQRYFEEEQNRRSQARETVHPKQSSVERIEEANLDLNGGEYVDFEDL